MPQNAILVWLGLLVVVVPIACFFYFHEMTRHGRTILFVMAGNMAQHEVVYKSFMEVVKAHAEDTLQIRTFVVPDASDKLGSAAICDTVLGTSADCIVVVGRMVAQVLVALAKKRGIHTPIVFIGADKPVELGLVDSLDHPGGTVTGLFTTAADESLCGRLLHAALPKVRSVLLPFYVTGDGYGAVASRAQAIKHYLRSFDILVTVVGIDGLADSLKRIEGLLLGHDIVMTLEDDTLNETQMVGCAKLARRYHMGFFSGIKHALAEGALFTYALEIRYSTEAALELVKKIIYDKASPGELPIVRLGSSREFIINQKRATELGLTIDVDAVIVKINADPALECVRGRVRVV
ncbi:MAG: putative tryptophan/tyrosine transport system substrate-binding protein [Candidatus Dependentiae bacterium]|nr:putative tryptophan/tyrosine transport system substrate-binding protein [Candidatus Dependentiae bacterium]